VFTERIFDLRKSRIPSGAIGVFRYPFCICTQIILDKLVTAECRGTLYSTVDLIGGKKDKGLEWT
jgi:hypothetical protein